MKAINKNIPADIRMMPKVKTNLEFLKPPKEILGPLLLVEAAFFAFSPFFRKVLVLGELVAMY